MSTADIADEVERRTLKMDLEHSQALVADLDAQIAKLVKQRDKHVAHVGKLAYQIANLPKP